MQTTIQQTIEFISTTRFEGEIIHKGDFVGEGENYGIYAEYPSIITDFKLNQNEQNPIRCTLLNVSPKKDIKVKQLMSGNKIVEIYRVKENTDYQYFYSKQAAENILDCIIEDFNQFKKELKDDDIKKYNTVEKYEKHLFGKASDGTLSYVLLGDDTDSRYDFLRNSILNKIKHMTLKKDL